MGDTTRENVLCIAPELGDIPKGTFGLVLADVANEVGSVFGNKQEQCQRYLAAHYLTLINPDDENKNTSAPGGIKSERLGDERVEYNGSQNLKDATRYDATTYGQIYESLRKKTTAGMGATFVTP